MMKKWIALSLLLPLVSSAQTRNEFWLKLNITHPLTQKWGLGMDLHHRRQANFQTTDKNIFHYPLGNYVRVWISYKLGREWALILSPIGYFQNEDILNSNGELKQTNELRISHGIIKTWNWDKLTNKNRLLYDARFAEFNRESHFFQSRFRMQNSIAIPLKKSDTRLSYLLSNEILLRSEKGKTSFDQNRIYNAVRYKIRKQEMDIGYQWVLQKGNNNLFHRNQLFVMVNLLIE